MVENVGIKVICQGILFKVAIDKHGMYGNDANAAKAAGHEFKSTTAFFDLQLPDVQLPLMAIIDYRGFRVTAMSLLPISGQETLVYGSSDGGRTVMASDPYFNQLMERAGKLLNLKPHLCGKDNPKVLSMPVDVEGHVTLKFRTKQSNSSSSSSSSPTRLDSDSKSSSSSSQPTSSSASTPSAATSTNVTSTSPSPSSGSYTTYLSDPLDKLRTSQKEVHEEEPRKRSFVVLDLARLFPPQMPLQPPEKGSKHRSYLYELLRPEYVKSNPVPLSSDAFSPFNSTDPKATTNNEEVASACHRLVTVRIPQFASYLEKGTLSGLTPVSQLDCSMLVSLMHRHGINIRFLSVLRRCLQFPRTRQLVLTEMVSRVVKDQVNEVLRNTTQTVQLPVEEPYKEAVVDYLNRLFGPGADEFWKTKITHAVCKKFSIKTLDLDMERDKESEEATTSPTSTARTIEMSQQQTTSTTPIASSAGTTTAPSAGRFVLVKSSRRHLPKTTEEPNLKLFIDPLSLWDRVSSLTGVVLRGDSLKVMTSGLGISSSDIKHIQSRVRVTDVLNRALAISVSLDAKMKKGTEAYRFYLRAHHQFQECLEVSTSNAATFYHWGVMLHQMSQHDFFRKKQHSLKILKLGVLPKLAQAVHIDPAHLDSHAELAWSLLDFLLHPMRFEAVNSKTTNSVALKDTTTLLERAGHHFALSIGDAQQVKPQDARTKKETSQSMVSSLTASMDSDRAAGGDTISQPQQIPSAASASPEAPADSPSMEVSNSTQSPPSPRTMSATSASKKKQKTSKKSSKTTSSIQPTDSLSTAPLTSYSESSSKTGLHPSGSSQQLTSEANEGNEHIPSEVQKRISAITDRIDSAPPSLFIALCYTLWERPRLSYAVLNRGVTMTELDLNDASFLPKFGFLLIPQVCPNLTTLRLRNAVFMDSITASQMLCSSETVEFGESSPDSPSSRNNNNGSASRVHLFNKLRTKVKSHIDKRHGIFSGAPSVSTSSALLPTLPQLKSLHLMSCDHLTDIDDFELIHWPHLQVLQFAKCGFSDGFFQTRFMANKLPSLTHITISGSNVSDASLTRIASQFGDQLKTLDLSVCINLNYVSCYNIMVQSPSLTALKSLTSLDLSGCHLISAASISQMAKVIFSAGERHHFTSHSLTGSSSTVSSKSNSKLPTSSKHQANSTATTVGAPTPAPHPTSPPSLTFLNFAGCSAITEDILNMFPKKCPLLRDLNIEKTCASGTLLQLLGQHCPRLESLHAPSCRRMEPISLLKVLQGCPLLQYLDASFWMWNKEEVVPKLAKSWNASSLPPHLALEQLYICSWSMDSTLTQLFYTCCPKLRVTDVSGCMALGPEIFAAMAQNCPLLEKVIAGGLVLSDDGVEALTLGCKMLRTLSFVRAHDLTDLSLESLCRCSKLTRLNLTHSSFITNQGIQTLVSAVPTITRLGLKGSKHITPEFIFEKLRHSCTELHVEMDATKVIPWSFPLP